MKLATLLGVRKVLHIENLGCPVLLDEIEDQESIVTEIGTINSVRNTRELCRGCASIA